MMQPASLNDLPAFKFGHATDDVAATGCSVIVAPEGAVGGVDVRGGAPATRETDLLKSENMVEVVHAIVLSGGSAFGLAAADGVMETLAARQIGFPFGGSYVPIVCGASLFDLMVGAPKKPGAEMGAQATENAFAEVPFEEGNVGAAAGASIGKLFGPDRAMKGGFGISTVRFGEVVVAALVALNAAGNICDETGNWIAGCRDQQDNIPSGTEAMCAAASALASSQKPRENTTLGVVVTNAKLTKPQANKLASTTHDAYARRISPVHTSNDGDIIFALASGEVESHPDLVATLANEAMSQAILNAAKKASSAFGIPGLA